MHDVSIRGIGSGLWSFNLVGFGRMIASLLNKLRARPHADSCATMAQAFSDRLRQWSRIARSTARGERVAVLVAPWLETAVPYYSLEWALRLDNAGFKVEVLWDSANFFGRNSANEEAAIFQALQRLPRQIVVQNVENTPLSHYDRDRLLVEKLLFENKTRSLGREPDEPSLHLIQPIDHSFFMGSVCSIV